MFRGILGPGILVMLLTLAAAYQATAANPVTPSYAGISAKNATGTAAQRAIEAFDLSPAVFVENKGQWEKNVRYGFDGKGVKVSFTDSGAVFQMVKSEGKEPNPEKRISEDTGGKAKFPGTVFGATFVGANAVRPAALEPSALTMSFYCGNDKSKWLTNVQTYSRILYKGLYDGVDLYTWGKRAGLKYEFHVAPGARWEKVAIRYEGIGGLQIDDSGAMHVRSVLGEMIDDAPVVYQETGAGRVEVEARFRLIDERTYGFDVTGAYDESLPLILDPDLAWGSYLGASGGDGCEGIAIDASGNAWVTGCRGEITGLGSKDDIFVARFTPTGTLDWIGFIGGRDDDEADGIAIDGSGNVWLTGTTWSTDFPTPSGFDAHLSGDSDAFVARIAPSGTLEFASYLGGNDWEMGNAIAVDASGDAWVTGETYSPDFPTPGGFDSDFGAYSDAFVARITASGTLAWASYLGGHESVYDEPVDFGTAIAIDASGNAWVTGYTHSDDFPTPGGFDTSIGFAADAFVAKITPSGTLAWATYLPGSGATYGSGIAVDAADNVWVTGETSSSDFPTPGGVDTTLNGMCDIFVMRITASGTLAWGSFLGGSDRDLGRGIAIDPQGNAWVTARTYSSDFPTPGGFQKTYGGECDAVVAKITPDGALEFASYLGGGDFESGHAIAADASGDAWVGGWTKSSDFPTPGGVFTHLGGSSDAFVVKISPLCFTCTPADGEVGVAYHETAAVAGGAAPYTWYIDAGSLPAGLDLDASTGAICGTPTTADTSSFTVRVTDDNGAFETKPLAITINPDATWLKIDRLRIVVPPLSGQGAFELRGSLNMPWNGNFPETVTLAIDDWSAVMDASSWKRAGNSNVYTCREGSIGGKITYWSSGGSKCLFTFTGSRETLQGHLPNLPSVPVRLRLGGDFDETVTAEVTTKNNVATLSTVGPLPAFRIEKLVISRHPRRSGHDALSFSGRLRLEEDFDPATDAIAMEIGPYALTLPAGTLPEAKNGAIRYTTVTPNGRLTFHFSSDAHRLTVTVTGVDLSSLTESTHVSLAITNHQGATWDYGFSLVANKSGTVYRY